MAGLAGCGHVPDVTVSYYLAESRLTFKVLRTVACDGKDNPVVATTVTPVVVHSARTSEVQRLRLHGLQGSLTDLDVKLEYFEDGRLKGINATNQGQGEAALKSVATLLGTLATLSGDAAPAANRKKQCELIATAGGGKPLSISYEGEVNPSTPRTPQTIRADAGSAYYAEQLAPTIGSVCAVVVDTGAPAAPVLAASAVSASASAAGRLVSARQPGWAEVHVRVKAGDKCESNPLWQGKVAVSQLGTAYQIPIPEPRTFGKQVFAMTFSESGALSSVQYSSESGASQSVAGLNALAGSFKGESTSEKVERVKAEADLILQQQRLVACMADPKTCK